MVNKQTIKSLKNRVDILVDLLPAAASEVDEKEETRRNDLKR